MLKKDIYVDSRMDLVEPVHISQWGIAKQGLIPAVGDTSLYKSLLGLSFYFCVF